MKMMDKMNIDLGGEFVYMASLLMKIKARMLLPVSDENEEQIEDPRTPLVKRLLEYQQYKNISQYLQEQYVSHSVHYPKGFYMEFDIKNEQLHDPRHNITLLTLSSIFQDLSSAVVIRNILLNNSGCSTFMYKHTNSEYVIDKIYPWKGAIYAFQKYDLEFHWTESSIKMGMCNFSKSLKHKNIGPLWNSMVQKNDYCEGLLLKKWPKYKDSIIICAFCFILSNDIRLSQIFLILLPEIYSKGLLYLELL